MTNPSMENNLPILIVEADQDLLHLLSRALARDYTVVAARDCLKATDLLNARRFSLLIVNLILPVLDGAQFIGILRGFREYDYLRVIALSPDPAVAAELTPDEVDWILHLPVEVYQLRQAVHTLVRESLLKAPTAERRPRASRRAGADGDGTRPSLDD